MFDQEVNRELMKAVQKYLLILRGLLVGGGIAWRLASRRRKLPCPSWLSFLLENPLTEGVPGGVILSRLGLEPGMQIKYLGVLHAFVVQIKECICPALLIFSLPLRPAA
jgi:hypothetical protein